MLVEIFHVAGLGVGADGPHGARGNHHGGYEQPEGGLQQGDQHQQRRPCGLHGHPPAQDADRGQTQQQAPIDEIDDQHEDDVGPEQQGKRRRSGPEVLLIDIGGVGNEQQQNRKGQGLEEQKAQTARGGENRPVALPYRHRIVPGRHRSRVGKQHHFHQQRHRQPVNGEKHENTGPPESGEKQTANARSHTGSHHGDKADQGEQSGRFPPGQLVPHHRRYTDSGPTASKSLEDTQQHESIQGLCQRQQEAGHGKHGQPGQHDPGATQAIGEWPAHQLTERQNEHIDRDT